MPKKTIGLIASLCIITVILLITALRTKPAEPKSPAGKNQLQPTLSLAHTELSLSPNPASLNSTGSGVIDVSINTNDNEITAVQLELQYDPKAISNVKVTTADFFDEPIVLINTNEQKTGRATYAIGISPAQPPLKGIGTVAKITFTRTPRSQIQQTNVELLPISLVTSSGVDQSVLKSAIGTTVTLLQ